MKTCLVCGIDKSLLEFYKKTGNRDGHQNTCKECQSAIGKDWRADNAEKLAAKRRAKRTVATQGTDTSIINLWRPVRSNV